MPTKNTPHAYVPAVVASSAAGSLRSKQHSGEGVDVVPVTTPKSSSDQVVQGELGAHGPALAPGLSPRFKSTEILPDAAAYLNVLFLIQSIVVD